MKRWLFCSLLALVYAVNARATEAPLGLAVSEGFYADRVIVRWAPVEGAQAYRVYRSTRPDLAFRMVLSGWQQGNVFEDRSAVEGVRYYYWVKAASSSLGDDASDFSAMVSGYARVGVIGQTALRALATRGSAPVELAWDEVLGAHYYRVYRSAKIDTSAAEPLSAWQAGRAFVDVSAEPGMRYYYYVKAATGARGERAGAFSSPLYAYRGVEAPDAVAMRSLEGVRLLWRDTPGAQLYQVWRSARPDSSSARAISEWLSERSFVDASAAPGTSYYYWVKATSERGVRASAFGGMSSAYRMLSQPQLRGVQTGREGLEIAWYAVDGATHYRIYRGEQPRVTSAQPQGDWQSELTFADADITPGVRYYYWVEAAVSASGERQSGFAVSHSGLLPLNKPLTPVVEEADDGRVLLRWDGVPGGQYYRIYRAESEDARRAQPVGDWQSAREWADVDALPGVRYFYWIEAAVDANGSVPSGLSAAATRFMAMPAPAGIRASRGLFAGQVEVDWQPVAGAEYYRVYRSEMTEANFRTVLSEWQRGTHFSDASAQPGVRYYYWVKAALDSGGRAAGRFSAAADGYVGADVLVAPGQVIASDGAHVDHIEIRWDEVLGGTHYRIYRSNSADPVHALPLSAWQQERRFVDRGVRPGQMYYYFVRSAGDAQGESASPMSAVNSGFRALAPVRSVLASAGLATGVEVEWSPVSGATHYRVYRSRQQEVASARPVSNWLRARYFTDQSAIPGVDYFYWVKAAPGDMGINAGDLGDQGAGFRALSRPLQLALVEQSAASLRLEWSSMPGATHYQVLRSTENDASAAVALTQWQRSTSFEDASAVPGVTHHYFIRAATDASGLRASPLSAAVEGFRPLASPAELNLRAESQGVRLEWSAVLGASHYQVLRSTVNDAATADPLGVWLTETSFDDASAVPGVTYYYFVRAATDALGARVSAAAANSVHRLLGSVSQVQAEGGDPDRVVIRWGAVEHASHYQVYRGEWPYPERSAPVTGWFSGTEWIDVGARPGVVYYYFVRAAIDGQGTNPGPIGGAQGAYRTLRGPSILSVSRSASGDVSLLWTGVEGASHYRVYRSATADTSMAEPLAGWQSDVSYIDEGAEPGVEYHYFVRAATSNLGHRASAFGGGGQGVRSVQPPVTVLGSTGGVEGVRIAWTPVSGATHYQVYRTSDLYNVTVYPISDWQSATFFDDADTAPGVSYHYFVRAASGSAGEAASNFSDGAVAYRGLQPPPSPLVSQGIVNAAHVRWDAVSGARYYRVYRSASSDASNAEAVSGWMAANSWTDSTQGPGQQVYYFVRAASDSAGAHSSSLSEVGSGYVGLQPPLVVQATTGDSLQVLLEWPAADGATHYQIYRATVGDALAAQELGTGWQTETSFVDRNANPGTIYHYFVRAATAADGQMASAYSAGVRGYAAVSPPADFQVVPSQGRIALSWSANGEFDIVEYRVYGASNPDSLVHIATVEPGVFPRVDISSVFPLPEAFNLVDMGLSLADDRQTIAETFERMFERAPSDFELAELYGGRRLPRDEIAQLRSDRSYFFRVVAVNANGRASAPSAGNVYASSTVPLSVSADDAAHIELSWFPVWGATYYQVYRHVENRPELAEPLSGWQQALRWADDSAEPGVPYYYFLRAAESASGDGASDLSPGYVGMRGLMAPTVVAATRELADRVRINWIEVPGAVAYRVYHSVQNDAPTAQPIGPWQGETALEHLAAVPGDNYYWVRAANRADGDVASALSSVGVGRRTGPLASPHVVEATWGDFKDYVRVHWEREPAAAFARLHRSATGDPQQAEPITEWVRWGLFDDRTADPDQTYYYYVQVASSAEGAHATELSAAVAGLRSGVVLVPQGLQTTMTSGRISLSWQPNPEEDVLRYRVYAGYEPDGLTLIDSVRADGDLRADIADIVPLPEAFNVVDMGLGINASRAEISARFAAYFGRDPLVPWVDELYAGRRLRKGDITHLEVGRTYYFKIAAVNGSQQQSSMSRPTEVLITERVAGKGLSDAGDEPLVTGVGFNAPNPFNASTLLRFSLSEEDAVALVIYDVLGREVRRLVDGPMAAGRYTVAWDSRDEAGRLAASGVYFYALQTRAHQYTGRMLLVR